MVLTAPPGQPVAQALAAVQQVLGDELIRLEAHPGDTDAALEAMGPLIEEASATLLVLTRRRVSRPPTTRRRR